MSTSTANDEAERYSMESLGNLHGRVDFFGTKRRTEMHYIHQKMKVMQTWIFIQSFVTALLVAYLIVLSVWLAPFFPMNYDTDDETDDNTVAIEALQRQYSTSDDQVANNTRSISALQDWQANHTNDMEEMLSIVNSQQAEINDLNNSTNQLNASVNLLQLRVHHLEDIVSKQGNHIGHLERRVAILEEYEKRNAISTGKDFAEVNTRLDHDDARLKKLECSQSRLNDSVKALQDTTHEKFCDMTKMIGDVIGNITAIKEGGRKYHENAKRIYSEINGSIAMLNQSVNNFKDHIDEDEIRYGEFFRNITAVEAGLGDRIDRLKNITGGIASTLDQTIDKAQDRVNWAIESFEEQDRVREVTAENARTELKAGLRKLQCSLDKLNDTFMGKIDDERDKFAIWVTEGLNDTKNMVLTKERIFQNRLVDTAKNLTDRLNDTRKNLEGQIDVVAQNIKDETTNREQVYFHLCDQVHGLNKTLSAENSAQNKQIKTANDNIENMNETIGEMQETQNGFSSQLGDLNGDLNRQKVQQISLKRSTGASLAILRNETCDLNKQMENITTEQGMLESRLTNAEARTSGVRNELKQDILNAEGQFLQTVASLQDDQLSGVNRLAKAEEAMEDLITSLGGDPAAIYDAVRRFIPEISVTTPLEQFAESPPPEFADPGSIKDQDQTIIRPDYNYDYDDHE